MDKMPSVTHKFSAAIKASCTTVAVSTSPQWCK